MSGSVVPSGLYPQPPAGNALGNPVDLIGKIQNLETQRLQQDTMRLQQQNLLRGMTEATQDRINQVLSSLPENFTDEQKERARLSIDGPGVVHSLVDRAFDAIEPMPRAGDPHEDEIRARRNDVAASARKFRMTPEQLESVHQVYTSPQGDTANVPGVSFGRPQFAGQGGGPGSGGPGTPGYTGGWGVSISPDQKKMLEESGNQGTALMSSQTDLENQNVLLKEFRQLSRNIGTDFSSLTGPEEEKFRRFAQRLGFDDPKLSDKDLYEKIKNQFLANMPASSVAGLHVSQSAIPAFDASPKAREAGINQLLAENDWRRATLREFQKRYPNSPQSFFSFMNETNTPGSPLSFLRPQVFRYSRMSDDAREAHYNSLNPAERERLKNDTRTFRATPYYEAN